MAASSCTSQLSLLVSHHYRKSSAFPSSCSGLVLPTSWNVKSQSAVVGSKCSLRQHFGGAISVDPNGSTRRRRSQQIVSARRPGKERDGALAQAVEEVKIPENSEPDNMWMGKKLEGLEPDFWEGEQWEIFGFLMQYLWAIGVVISLVACAVAVTSYNSGAVDIRETEVFKEALENQVDAGSSFDSDSLQDFPEATEAPSLE